MGESFCYNEYVIRSQESGILAENLYQQVLENGKVVYASEVIAAIAALSAQEVDGVVSFSTSTKTRWGKKINAKGVRVTISGDEVIVYLYLSMRYGVKITEVAWAVQENVKKAVENMTGLIVSQVNVHVDGMDFNKAVKD